MLDRLPLFARACALTTTSFCHAVVPCFEQLSQRMQPLMYELILQSLMQKREARPLIAHKGSRDPNISRN